jgi:alpha/beta superfamily hydrolase
VWGEHLLDSMIAKIMFVGAYQSILHLPYSSTHKPVWETYFKCNEASLHIAATSLPSSNCNKLIFYLHGNAGSIYYNWYEVIESLAKHSGAVVATFDYRKFGESTSKDFPSPVNSIQDAKEILSYLKEVYPSACIAFYGRSLGAAIALSIHVGQKRTALFLETPFLGEHSTYFGFNMVQERMSCKSALQHMDPKFTFVALAEKDEIICNKKVIDLLGLPNENITIVSNVNHNHVYESQEWSDLFQIWLTRWGSSMCV